jgi:hypothetical protein
VIVQRCQSLEAAVADGTDERSVAVVVTAAAASAAAIAVLIDASQKTHYRGNRIFLAGEVVLVFLFLKLKRFFKKVYASILGRKVGKKVPKICLT